MLNRSVIMGRLTRDPELKYTQTGTPVVSFTVACERDFSRNGEPRETDFINLVAWRNTAEFIGKYFHKGNMVAVEGRLQARKWEDKYQQKRTDLEILVDNVYFAESKAATNDFASQNDNVTAIHVPTATSDFVPLECDDDVSF